MRPSKMRFIGGEDSIFVEHSIAENQHLFYLKVDKGWFSKGGSSSRIEIDFPLATIENLDQPALTGRVRLKLNIPRLLNCKPCQLHVKSILRHENTSHSSKIIKRVQNDRDDEARPIGLDETLESSVSLYIG